MMFLSSKIRALIGLLFIFLFPCLIFVFSLENFENFAAENERRQISQELEILLDKMTDIHEDRHFLHLYLQRVFKHSDSLGSRKEFFRKLKKSFGSHIRFIIWNNDGSIDKELSDETGYLFVLKKMFQTIEQVDSHVRSVFAPAPQNLKFVRSNIKLLRQYFGSMLVGEILDYPLFEGLRGKVIEISHEPEKGYFWFHKGKSFSAAVFIHAKLKKKNIGLNSVLRSHNRKQQKTAVGFLLTPSLKYHGPSLVESDIALLKMQALNHKRGLFSLQTSPKFHSLFRQISHDKQLFAVRWRDPQESIAARIGFRVLKVILIISFIAYCANLRNPRSCYTVKSRIVALLVFAAALPAMILSMVGYEFLHYKIVSLINQKQIDGVRILNELDSLYPMAKQRIASQINQQIAEANKKYGNQAWPESVKSSFKKNIELHMPTEFGLYKPGSGVEFAGGSQLDGEITYNFTRYFPELIEDLNNSLELKRTYSKNKLEGFADDFDRLAESLNSFGRITMRNLGDELRLVYLNSIGIPEKSGSRGIIGLSWEIEAFQNNFFSEELENINRDLSPGKIMVMSRESGLTYPGRRKAQSRAENVLKQAFFNKFSFAQSLKIENELFIASAIQGLNLEQVSLMFLFPRRILEEEVWQLQRNMLAAAFLFLCIITAAIWKFSRDLLQPVILLESGIEAVNKRDFNFKLQFSSSDEFDDLIRTFNSAMENMKDLSLAKSVQESLLPPSDFSRDRIDIFVKTSFMTSMGGDYFDIAHSENQVFIVFGDVAGHGIPAALVMAMIKSVFTDCQGRYEGSHFLERCNETLMYLARKGWKRMMTLQFLAIDSVTGQFSLTNAGHCFPALVTEGSPDVSYVQARGIPLGNKFAINYQSVHGNLAPGQTLILYSDGIIEATDKNLEPFGFDRFERLISSAYCENTRDYCEKIIDEVIAWSASRTDDLSAMVLRFKK